MVKSPVVAIFISFCCLPNFHLKLELISRVEFNSADFTILFFLSRSSVELKSGLASCCDIAVCCTARSKLLAAVCPGAFLLLDDISADHENVSDTVADNRVWDDSKG